MKRKKGTKRTDRPRISVFRSNRYIYAQIIDDAKGVTLVSASDFSLPATQTTTKKNSAAGKQQKGTGETRRMKIAFAVGGDLAKKAKAKKITRVWFDRRAYKYHGRIKALAEGARQGGLQF